MICNPVLRGFCPDPSIIRVGGDFFLGVSTFEWWPGVKLFHSVDLKNWEQIRSPLRRESQLNMVGNPTSGGVWAPCLSYDGKFFYLVFTDVKTKKGRYYNTHNFMVFTSDIYGEWSEPVFLNSRGFDPSLFHDRDGRKYLLNMLNGFKGVLVQELDPDGWKLIGESKNVYPGSGLGCTEGPHMYHIGEWYYLLVAEGGTGYDHCISLARSKSVWGPFETAPDNPILTSDRQGINALQKCGHGDIVDTKMGEWYLVHLCSRPLKGQEWCTLGRETAIQKVCWSEDGWLQLAGGGKFAELETPEPLGCVADAVINGSFVDCFEKEQLDVRYVSPRVSYEEFADITARHGFLRLRGQESMNSLHHVSLIAVRQQEIRAKVETAMEFQPDYQEQLAGLAYMYDAMNYYVLGKTVSEEGKAILTLVKSDRGVITDEIVSVEIPDDHMLGLRGELSEDGTGIGFYYRLNQGEWIPVEGFYSTDIVTDEHCRGFTGAHFGMYAHDMTGLKCFADFASFSVHYVFEPETVSNNS